MSHRDRMKPQTWCVVQPDGCMLAHHDNRFRAESLLRRINAWRLSSHPHAPGTAAVLMSYERFQAMHHGAPRD